MELFGILDTFCVALTVHFFLNAALCKKMSLTISPLLCKVINTAKDFNHHLVTSVLLSFFLHRGRLEV